jgi:hypothetical protein
MFIKTSVVCFYFFWMSKGKHVWHCSYSSISIFNDTDKEGRELPDCANKGAMCMLLTLFNIYKLCV